MRARTFFEGCGIGIALTLSYTWEQLTPDHITGLYLRALPVSSVAGGTALVLSAAALLGWGAVALLERCDGKKKTLAWVLLTALVPAVLIRTVLTLAEAPFHISSTAAMFVTLLIPAALMWHVAPAIYTKIVNAFQWGYACVGICILWMLPQLVVIAVHRQQHDTLEVARVTGVRADAQAAAGQKRMVWVLLDEMSYDQAFDHRQTGLKLPNLDVVRGESTSFGEVLPAGYYTDRIVPAILRGRAVVQIRSSLDGTLSVRERAQAPWERFDPQVTVFGDAERMGWSTGIAGWFNPYCRLFGTVVERCSWMPESKVFPGHMTSTSTSWKNMLALLGRKFRGGKENALADEHRAAYQTLLTQGVQLIGDERMRFVFVHLPAPHPPGIYDRAHGQWRNGGSYLDNLALADMAMGTLLDAVNKTASAQNTILIVSSDHSMRVLKWRGGRYWTTEDEQVFHDRFDPRPVWMVHFPGQQTARREDAPFAEVKMHDMMEAMLRGQMNEADDLDAWVRAENMH
jgi:hypothetical protein